MPSPASVQPPPVRARRSPDRSTLAPVARRRAPGRTRRSPARAGGTIAAAAVATLVALGASAPGAHADAVLSAVSSTVNLGPVNPTLGPVGAVRFRNTDAGGSERVNIGVVAQSPMSTDCGEDFGASINANDTRDCNVSIAPAGLNDGDVVTRSIVATARLASVGPTAGDPRGSATVRLTVTIDRTPPAPPTFSPAPPAETPSRTPSFSYVSPGAADYRCTVDGQPLACTSIAVTGTLRAGRHTFTARAVDAAGNVSEPLSHGFRVKPPGAGVPILDRTVVPLGVLRAPAAGVQTVTVFNDGGEDLALPDRPVVVEPFSFRIGNVCPSEIASGESCTMLLGYVGPAAGVQSQTFDAAPEAPGGTFSATVDGRAPLAAPTLGEVASPAETSRRITFSRTEPDVRRLECAFDSVTYLTCTSPFVRTGLSDGDHVLRVRQVGVENLTSPVREVPFRVARAVIPTAPPTVAADDDSRRPGSRFVATPGTATGTVPITRALQWERCPAAGACATIPGATDAAYAATDADAGFALRVVETATNEVGPVEIPSVRTTPIRPTLAAPDLPDPVVLAEDRRRFTFASDEDDVVRFECAEDDEPFAPCSSPLLLAGLAEGDHRLRVRQVAADGVVSPLAESTYRVAFAVRVVRVPRVEGPGGAGAGGAGAGGAEAGGTGAGGAEAGGTGAGGAGTGGAGTAGAGSAETGTAGTPRPGSTFTAIPGVYSGTAPIGTTREWQRCRGGSCEPIAGATGASYVAVALDVGATLRVSEVATNEVGPLRATSEQTATIAPAPVDPSSGGPGPVVQAPSGTVRITAAPKVTGLARLITVAATPSGRGTIEAVATHAGPNRARPRALPLLQAGPSRLVYARAKPQAVTRSGPVTLRLKRTVGGRTAAYRGRFLTLRLTVRFVPEGGKPVATIRNVRVQIRR